MISNSGSDERGGIANGAAGDQTGGEWRRRSWYDGGWDVVLRHPDDRIRGLLAEMAAAAADNDLIGYDQAQRLTFNQQLERSGWRPERIGTACEADCSSGVAAIVRGAGHRLGVSALKGVDSASWTGNLRSRLVSAGFKALTAPRYLASDAYLLQGDILLNDVGGGHVCVNLSDGRLSGGEAGGAGLEAARSDIPVLRYRASVDPAGGRWLPEMEDHRDTGGSADDFAGDGANPLCYLAIDMPGWYQVRTAVGWLERVRSYDVSDLVHGCAGDGTPIVAVRCYYETPDPAETGWLGVEYSVAPVGGGFLPDMVDLSDTGGSADDFAGNGGPVARFRARLVRL